MVPSDETLETVETEDTGAEVQPKLNLDVKVDKPSACERHVTVTIPAEDIERYYDKAFGDLMPSATIPGFRAGRAPRKLVESRFRKDLADQVKGSLLMDSMAQVTEDEKLSAISEPNLNVAAIEVPESGPMTFEFDLEVRPDFDMPKWEGLTIERPTREFGREDVDRSLKQLLTRHGQLIPHEGEAELGDYVTVNLTFKNGDQTISETKEQVICIRPALSFRDGNVRDFGDRMVGVKAGETRELTVEVSDAAADPALKGKTVAATFEVLEVKKLKLPELTPDFLSELGGFESEGELRDALMEHLQRQLEYHQQQRARQQVTALLTAAADWELPPDLLRRQSKREMERSKLELRRSGFGDAEIRQHENELRQNTLSNTARALKEHFILERIAEDAGIEDLPEDYEAEIRLIASQSGESPRRVRAQLEKRDLMDILRNQVIERKTIDLVLSKATFTDVPFQPEGAETEALDQATTGESDADIPEAVPDAQARPGMSTQTPE